MWNRFDIVEAYYIYLVQYHEGQWSDTYRRLCRMSKYFKPSPMLCNEEDLEENSRKIYNNLVNGGYKK